MYTKQQKLNKYKYITLYLVKLAGYTKTKLRIVAHYLLILLYNLRYLSIWLSLKNEKTNIFF